MKDEILCIECRAARLYAEMYIPDENPSPAVLICHGMDTQGFHYLPMYRQLARKAREQGFLSLAFDFRGVGKSGGTLDYGFGERDDLRCVLNYLGSMREVVSDRIFVVGHSLGGAVSLYALQGEKSVKGLVLWSVPKDHNYNVKKFIARTRGRLGLYLFLLFSQIDRVFDVSKFFRLRVYGIDLRLKHGRGKLMKLNECQAISKLVGMPVLIVNGASDVIVGPDEAQEVFSSANEPKKLVLIQSADHVYKGKENELVSRTLEWIEEQNRSLLK